MGQGHAAAVIGEGERFFPLGRSRGGDPNIARAGIASVLGQFPEEKPGVVAIGAGNGFGQAAEL